MDLEKLIKLILSNPNNISIKYSNINGKEKLIVNGTDLTDQDCDDSQIKEKIAEYKDKIEKLDDYIFELVMNEAEARNFNLPAMNRGLELEKYNSQEKLYANNVIEIMTELIQEILRKEIEKLTNTLDMFSANN